MSFHQNGIPETREENIVIMILYHKVAAKCRSLNCIEEKMARLSGEHLCVDALWFKVMRTPISPELV
jgi:hypothetical protein